MSFKHLRSILALGLLVVACRSGPTNTGPIPTRLVLVVFPGATVVNGGLLDPQPRLQVQDAEGSPVTVRGIRVTVSLASGGGQLGGTLSVESEDDGRVVFTDLTLTGTVGPRTLRFSATGLASATSGTIELTAGPASVLTATAGNNQTVAAGTPVPILPAVRLTDASGNPVAGVLITFSVFAGGGSATATEVATGADGVATVGSWTLGTALGPNSLIATAAGLLAEVVFTASAVVGAAADLEAVEGSGQTTSLGGIVPIAPAVRVTDAFGNPIAGLAITFSISGGGGTVTGANAIADALGIARVGSWALGLVAGPNTLTAMRTGLPAVHFNATAEAFNVTVLTAGLNHTCAVSGGPSYCWGDNSSAQFGNGGAVPSSAPMLVTSPVTFTSLTAGSAHSCGLTAAGAAYCWGANAAGQVGDGTTAQRIVPTLVFGGHIFTALSAGGAHTCGLRVDGAILCWGSGANGRLGTGGTIGFPVPVLAAGGHSFQSVSAGVAHTCGVRDDGIVLCWGANSNGRLGDGTGLDQSVPTPVSGGTVYSAVAAGGAHTCAITPGGMGFCWGVGTSGQLGNAASANQFVPVAVSGGHTFASIATGSAHSCGVVAGGAGFCWGLNANGQLGDGTAVSRNVPAAVAGELNFGSISPGLDHTCAQGTGGAAFCWGRNQDGQLGDGTMVGRPSPAGVQRP